MNFVDTHAHLDFVSDLDLAISEASKEGISKIITIGTSIDCSKTCVEIANKIKNLKVFATCGIHPEDGKSDYLKYGDNFILELKKVCQSSELVVGIGECGLDYYFGSINQPETTEDDKKYQKKLFLAQLELASELKLPIVIHCRNAWSETFEILDDSSFAKKISNPGVFHSWTGNLDAARKALNYGFYISFSGILTFKNAQNVQEVAKFAPLDRILLETDSPFLAPEPVRGQKNWPKNVKITAEFLANIRKEPIELIAEKTFSNCEELFGV